MIADFHWRMPAPEDWLERLAVVDEGLRGGLDAAGLNAAGVELRRLARCRLDPRQQRKLEGAAGRLASADGTPDHFRRLRIGLLSARTLSYLPRPIAAAGLARGLLIEVTEGPYDQIGLFAFGPVDPFADAGPLDAVVVNLDISMFPAGDILDAAGAERRLDDARALIEATVEAIGRKTGARAIVATLPEVVDRIASADRGLAGSDLGFVGALNRLIARGGETGDWLVWDLAALAADIGHGRWFDVVRYHQAKAPFAIELSPLVADHLCGVLAAFAGKSGRVIVLDLDNTVWGGVIGDDGLDGIKLGQNSPVGEAFVAFQRYVLRLRERGVIIAVCSKNTDAIAREPFASHPEMVLRENHVAVFQANWQDKASNIRVIAETLNLGLESLVFVDDNPAERALVRQELPLVQVLEMHGDPALYIRNVADSGVFEHLRLSAEDLGRAEAYGAEAKRAEVRSKMANYADYLASLEMRMDIAPFDDVGRMRIAQLINKSNQFNLTTRRYNEEAVRRMTGDPSLLCWQISLGDKFGHHGVVGIVIVRASGREWSIDTWVQSCRVLSRGVEEAVMNTLLTKAREAGAEVVHGEYIETARNGIVADFFDRLGFERGERPTEDGGVAYRSVVAGYEPKAVYIDIQLAGAAAAD